MFSKRAGILLIGFILISGFQLVVFFVFPTNAPALPGIQQSTSLVPDFSLVLSTYSMYILQGGGSSVTATVMSIAGFSAPVVLTTSWNGPNPQGVTLSLPDQVEPVAGASAKFLLTVTSTSQTPVGSYTLVLDARSGSYIQHQATVTISVASSTGLMVQPLIGFTWPMSTIPVSIQNQPSYARQAVLDAMSTWNAAQEWFIQTYEPGGTVFQLYEVPASTDNGVNVIFNQTQTDPDNWGIASCTNAYSNYVFTKVHCNISLDLAFSSGQALTQSQLQSLAAQQLGYALGLASTTFSEYDLMNHKAPSHEITLPSTLNLYAVSLLTRTNSINSLPSSPVSLPDNVPYATMSLSVSSSTTTASSSFQTLTVTTDKAAYSCGETVSVTAVLSGGTTSGRILGFEAHDQSGAVFRSGSYVTNPSGTVSFTFVLPSACQAGSYSVIVSSQTASERSSFYVEQNASTQVSQSSSSTSSTSVAANQTSTTGSITISFPQIPGFPWESIIVGILLGLSVLVFVRQRRR